MKKLSILFLLLSFIMVGCKSKEEKAAELIKNELSKTLYDFESYSPIETIVTEAIHSAYTDTAHWAKAKVLLYSFNKTNDYLNEAKEARERMDIWGEPSRYSSSYSDNQYYKYKKEWEDKTDKALNSWEFVKTLAKNLKDTLQTINSENVVGWEVRHRFRCKTKGGHSTIGDYRYIIDKDFKEILIYEDTEDEDSKKIREIIESVIKGEFD